VNNFTEEHTSMSSLHVDYLTLIPTGESTRGPHNYEVLQLVF